MNGASFVADTNQQLAVRRADACWPLFLQRPPSDSRQFFFFNSIKFPFEDE
jgi:hypothetical protein